MSKLDDIVDKDLIARIVDWFGEPSAPQRPRRADDDVSPDVAKHYANIARACQAVTPEMLAYVERHNQVADELANREPVGLEVSDIARYSPERAPHGGISAPGYYEQPRWIQDVLKAENTPQAVLRDLHRPVEDFSSIAMERTEFHSDITGEGRRAQIRDLMGQQYQIDMSDFALGWRAGQAALAELDELLSAPWENSKPAAPRPRASQAAPSADNAYWFGD